MQHNTKLSSAASKLSPNVLPHEIVKINIDDVPLIERKYESSKKDKKEKAAAAAAAAGGEAPAAAEGGKKSKKDKVAAAAAAAMEADAGLAAGTIVDQKGAAEGSGAAAGQQPAAAGQKKEKKAKKEGASAGVEGGKPKKEKGGGGGAAPAEPEVITPGLVDMRVGHIIDGASNLQGLLITARRRQTNSSSSFCIAVQSRSTRMQTRCILSRLMLEKRSQGRSCPV